MTAVPLFRIVGSQNEIWHFLFTFDDDNNNPKNEKEIQDNNADVCKKKICFELRLLNAVGAKIPLFSNEILNILQNTYY